MNKLKPTKFKDDDVYILDSIETKNSFWVKCETWDWGEGVVYVFNRPNGFGILESNDGDNTGLNEVKITCKKFKSISDALKYQYPPYGTRGPSLEEFQTEQGYNIEQVIFNYDDVLNNNFMIVKDVILHQKFASKILGELKIRGITKDVNLVVKPLGFKPRLLTSVSKPEFYISAIIERNIFGANGYSSIVGNKINLSSKVSLIRSF